MACLTCLPPGSRQSPVTLRLFSKGPQPGIVVFVSLVFDGFTRVYHTFLSFSLPASPHPQGTALKPIFFPTNPHLPSCHFPCELLFN